MGRQASAEPSSESLTWALPSQVRGQQKQYQPLDHLGRAIETSKKKACLPGDIKVFFPRPFFNFMGKANNRVFVFYQKS